MRFIFNNWIILLTIILMIFILPFILSKYCLNNPTLLTLKQVFKVFFTNRINLLVIFTSVYIASFIFNLINADFGLREALFGATYLVLGYGIMFWVGFLFYVFVLDIVLFSVYKDAKYITFKLAIEWVLISLPFIYWVVRYNQWMFLIGVFAFLLGQYLRRPHIIRIFE